MIIMVIEIIIAVLKDSITRFLFLAPKLYPMIGLNPWAKPNIGMNIKD
ncbi:hypothetical protein SDC9_204469 [bioreactor metagenome]|uniref:Uncharacterized protein n=1 Tax=bioreactor metagenome TaxID=1076179 RepID=A0A645J046_9ZZZZ